MGRLLQQLFVWSEYKRQKASGREKTRGRRKEAVRRGDERRREVRLTLCWMTSLLLKQNVPFLSVFFLFDKWKGKGKQAEEMDSKDGAVTLSEFSLCVFFYCRRNKRLFFSHKRLPSQHQLRGVTVTACSFRLCHKNMLTQTLSSDVGCSIFRDS